MTARNSGLVNTCVIVAEVGGRRVGYRKDAAVSSTFVGVPVEHFGDRTGRLLEDLDLA